VKRFLVDTNVISELRRAKPHGAVMAWLEATDSGSLVLSAVVVGEIQLGIEKTRTNDPVRAAQLEAWLESTVGAFDILPMDTHAFRSFARLMVGQPEYLVMDAMIAATAIENDLTVATRNVMDFVRFDVPTYNPFEFPR
jgi:toxin FitB